MARKKNKGEAPKKSGPPTIQNRKARHDYHISDTYDAGVVLKGSEVKSLREGKASLQEAYAFISKGECFISGLTIQPYENMNTFEEIKTDRTRKLLLRKREIVKIEKSLAEKGFTLVPLKIYFVRGLVKIQLGLGKGKKEYDKRYDIKKRDVEREMRRAMK